MFISRVTLKNINVKFLLYIDEKMQIKKKVT